MAVFCRPRRILPPRYHLHHRASPIARPGASQAPYTCLGLTLRLQLLHVSVSRSASETSVSLTVIQSSQARVMGQSSSASTTTLANSAMKDPSKSMKQNTAGTRFAFLAIGTASATTSMITKTRLVVEKQTLFSSERGAVGGAGNIMRHWKTSVVGSIMLLSTFGRATARPITTNRIHRRLIMAALTMFSTMMSMVTMTQSNLM